ncbi:aminotransferase class III-fold pyridoxal phosphate-dependent enzyme [Natronosporangium hydrolyticum]|uniref:Aminotransferase class III-fold pyridoxal phosphate-dependent enzyme n=1 Tax=Natronosporangium hydrolyticum TaxID=2811111 RepID=A0A895YPP9_9ACTN|nr:aminotransferase class III-fold pyridoxal phosphate-dependent enzyme [Natronosporangium hydrolyticum]QSB15938.1 aminotransferase class III-fold pyridoxal phosphate-dependent enzyme [Natronosporangium hydrolyticum]
MSETELRSVFRPASSATIELIARQHQEQRCALLMASNYVNPAAAKLGYLLDQLVPVESTGPRVSYLLSSGLEALATVIKLARHTAVQAGRDTGGWVLLLDPRERYQRLMDPVGAGVDSALIPHVVSAATADDARRRYPGYPFTAVIVVRDSDHRLDDPSLTDLLRECRQAHGLVALCCIDQELSGAIFDDPIGADVMVFGEPLADRQVPFGAITMSAAAHRIWRDRVNCFAHTSTYGGNALCAELVLDRLDHAGFVADHHRDVMAEIESDPATTLEYWGRHINPNVAEMAAVFHLNVDVRRAAGGRLVTGDGRDVIDCAGGFGSNLRGHNPPDLVPRVLRSHDPAHDYFADLEQELVRLTGLGRAFPAVSGAIANHVAVEVAALAQPQRRTVVTFKGNYGGKTLFSLNLSKYGPQKTESVAEAFRPYYSDLVYLDPFAPDAAAQFEQIVREREVALVWFEYIQGATCAPIPEPLINAIDRLRDEGGYLVGVDEVLTGGWRSSPNYLAHPATMRTADIVTLGKTISDMTMPAAAVVVSDQVYERAYHTAPEQVAELAVRHRHNLGAHISWHALRTLVDGGLEPHQQAYAELRTCLDDICRRSKVLGEVVGSAAHLRLTMGHRLLSFSHGSAPGTLLTLALSDLIFQRGGVYMPLLAIRHRVAADPADLRELAARIDTAVRDITPGMIYRYALGCLLGQKLPWLGRLLRGKAARPQPQLAGASAVGAAETPTTRRRLS